MEELHINFTAVIVAVVATFLFSFIWYTVLFGKAWAVEMGFDMSVKPPASTMIKGMLFMILGNIFLAFVFAHNIAAWGFVPESKAMAPIVQIINSAMFTWLGFYLPGDLSRVAWEKHSWKLFAINTFYHLIMLFIAASILTYIR